MSEAMHEPEYLGFSNEQNARRVSELVHAYNRISEDHGETTVTLFYLQYGNRFDITANLPSRPKFTVRIDNGEPVGMQARPSDLVINDNGNMEDLLLQEIENHVLKNGGIAT